MIATLSAADQAAAQTDTLLLTGWAFAVVLLVAFIVAFYFYTREATGKQAAEQRVRDLTESERDAKQRAYELTVRLAEARAELRLRPRVTVRDAVRMVGR